ncbi:MAG: tyrosinase family protein [Candidatus Eremiobacteraeota bacterium]|nr:tyrosinase family protein [Candidatus Eremiobacteraeota bacterium]
MPNENAAAAPAPRPSRYRRFQEIMTAASAGSSATYEGYGTFWNLPLEELKRLRLYGVPMFLGDDPQRPLTGAQSGIVRGLRGEYPFDETLFPPLPWGGKRVADVDVALIEQWIDAGCPEPDADPAEVQDDARRRALANGDAAHPEHDGNVNQFFAEKGSIKQRKNVNALSDDELTRLRNAFAWMKKYDAWYLDERSFQYWARIHASQCQHGWEQFLTWHRAYLYGFELKLQDYDPSVTLPYWDWTDDSAKDVIVSVQDMGPKVDNRDNGIIPAAFQCWIDAEGLKNLAGKIPSDVLAALKTVQDKPFNSGSRLFATAGIDYGKDRASDKAIIAELERINPLFHWKRWPGGNASLIFQAYPQQDDVDQIMKIENFFDFGSGSTDDQFFGALENIHNLIHNFTGGLNPNYKYNPATDEAQDDPANPDDGEVAFGDMQNGAFTAFDPIFWFHHSNVDRLWAQWQALHPSAHPDDPTAVLPPWNFTVQDTYSTRKLGYEYVAKTHLFLTDSDTGIQRFRSEAVSVPPQVIDKRRRAEIRVHTVQYVTRAGYHVRAFLNSPDANASTDVRNNERYVGQVNVLTGLCIGGPGHCAVPQRPTNRFDRRPRHHKTPSNLRFDATGVVRALSAKGETDFHVNLVVLNTDGTPADDALFIDGVSLNFLD